VNAVIEKRSVVLSEKQMSKCHNIYIVQSVFFLIWLNFKKYLRNYYFISVAKENTEYVQMAIYRLSMSLRSILANGTHLIFSSLFPSSPLLQHDFR
jgi:hypothetical protein